MLVVIDHKIDYIDSSTHRRGIEELDAEAVHGEIHNLQLEHSEGTAGLCNMTYQSDADALRIVKNAIKMAEAVSREPDMLHTQWDGVNKQYPLFQLFGTNQPGPLGDSILNLIANLEDLCAEEFTLNQVPLPAKVYGDLHGQFRDMLLFLYYYGFPSRIGGRSYVFNGDWVDRGKHQLETICLVYALKLAYPDKVFLNRGNHEELSQNRHMGKDGFEEHCRQALGQQLGDRVFMAFAQSYTYLPLASLLGDNCLVVHGGIGDGRWELSYLDEIERPINDEDLSNDKIAYNIMWSDPIDEDKKDCFGVHDSPRDQHRNLMVRFGVDVSQFFCERNGIGMIIRSHEALQNGDGYEVMHAEHLTRVFSARDYGKGQMCNDGAILSVTIKKGKVLVTPQVLKSVVKQQRRQGNAMQSPQNSPRSQSRGPSPSPSPDRSPRPSLDDWRSSR
jgi:hypothetical protein